MQMQFLQFCPVTSWVQEGRPWRGWSRCPPWPPCCVRDCWGGREAASRGPWPWECLSRPRQNSQTSLSGRSWSCRRHTCRRPGWSDWKENKADSPEPPVHPSPSFVEEDVLQELRPGGRGEVEDLWTKLRPAWGQSKQVVSVLKISSVTTLMGVTCPSPRPTCPSGSCRLRPISPLDSCRRRRRGRTCHHLQWESPWLHSSWGRACSDPPPGLSTPSEWRISTFHISASSSQLLSVFLS